MMKKHFLSISLIVLTGLFIYGATLQSPYHWDDYRTIVDNPALSDPLRIPAVFSFWPTRAFLFWTFSLNSAAGSCRLLLCHLTNITIHLSAAVLLYLLIYRTLSLAIPNPVGAASRRSGRRSGRMTGRMTDSPDSHKEYAWIAAIAALIFVSHPVATGAVTYLIQRGVSLSAALGLFSLLIYTYARDIFFREGRGFLSLRHILLYGLSLILLFLAMLTKEGALVFPILIIGWEFILGEKKYRHSVSRDTGNLSKEVRSAGLQSCPEKAGLKSCTTSDSFPGYQMIRKKLPGRTRLLYLLPLLLTIAIIPLISLTTTKSPALQDDILYRINRPWHPVTVTFLDGGAGSYLSGSWEYFLTQLKSIAIYIRLAFIPIRQNFYYHLMPRHSLFEGKTIFFLMGYLTIIIVGIRLVIRVSTGRSKQAVRDERRTVGEVYNLDSGERTGIGGSGDQVPTTPLFHQSNTPAPISCKLIGAGTLWFFIALIPTSSFLILWPFLSEFHLYLSLAGISFFWAGVLLLPRKPGTRRLFRSLLLLVIFAFALLAIKRNAVYSSAVTLWEDTVKKSPELAPAHSNLAAAYIGRGDFIKAINQSRLAMDLNSKFNGYRNLRTAYRARGEMEKANALIEEEIERFPESYRGYYEKALTIINIDPAGAHRLLIKSLTRNPPSNIRERIELILKHIEEVVEVRSDNK